MQLQFETNYDNYKWKYVRVKLHNDHKSITITEG